jgi:O-antigen ligase
MGRSGELAPALASRSVRYLLLYGGALLLAIVVGVVVAYSEIIYGPNGPYMVLGALLAMAAAGVILLQWRLGALLLAAALPFQTAINFGPVVSGMKTLGFLTFAAFAVALFTDRDLFERFAKLLQQPLALAVLAFVLWILASILWAPDKGKALDATVTFLALFGLMVVFGSLERKYLVWAWACLAFSAALSVPAGYILPLPEGSDMAVSGRFGPAGAGPNTYSLIMTIAFFAAYFGLLRHHKLTAYLLTPVFVYGIIATGSRTGLIALAATPLLALVIPRLASRLGWRTLGLYVLGSAALVVVALALPSVDETALDRYTTLTNVESADTWNGRLSLWQGALDVIGSHPVLGVGTGNYAEAALDYSETVQAHSARKAAAKGGELSGVTHNVVLGVTSELGLVGLVLFLGIVFYAFKTAWLIAQRSDLGTGIFLGLIVAMLGGMTQPWENEKIVYVLYGSVLALQLHYSGPGAHSSAEQEVPADY